MLTIRPVFLFPILPFLSRHLCAPPSLCRCVFLPFFHSHQVTRPPVGGVEFPLSQRRRQFEPHKAHKSCSAPSLLSRSRPFLPPIHHCPCAFLAVPLTFYFFALFLSLSVSFFLLESDKQTKSNCRPTVKHIHTFTKITSELSYSQETEKKSN